MTKEIYAQVLTQVFLENKNQTEAFENFFKKFKSFLEKKNQDSMLPSIITQLEKNLESAMESSKTILTVRDVDQAKALSEEIMKKDFDFNNLEIEEDPKIIGGYVLKDNNNIVDNSYKTRLLEAYKNIVSS